MKLKSIFSNSVCCLLIGSLLFSCNQEVSVSEPQVFQIELAKIFIDSKPANVEIFVDGKNSGKRTPDTVSFLANGQHNISLKMYLFQDFNIKMDADTNNISSYFHDYYSYPENFAAVTINSTPKNASVYFDDTLLVSKTPYILKDIYPGDHRFKLTYPEHRSDSTKLFLRGGTNTKLDFFLEDTTIWVNYNRNNSPLTSYNITDVYVDKNDQVWCATSDAGLFLIKNNTWEILNSENSILYGDFINRIVEDPVGNIWLCTGKGLVKYDYLDWKIYTTFDTDLPSNFITDISFDNFGNAWIATPKGLVRFNGYEFKVFNNRNSGIPSEFVTCVFADVNEIWIGTGGSGIGIYNPELNSWSGYTEPSIFGNTVDDIIIDKNGQMWSAVKPANTSDLTGGLARLTIDGFWSSVSMGDTYEIINELCLDPDKNLWIAAEKGAVMFISNGNFTTYNVGNSGLTKNNISSVAFDSKGNIWFGSKGGGLTKYKTWNDPDY
ncbi:MAG: PEGA domain-containing protein [Melioribacteraceae bacterium]|nr:PEGA domain-containing protein [Melioribacteraceae bacterium]